MSNIIDKHECLEIPMSLWDVIKILLTVTANKWVLSKCNGYGAYETVFYKVRFCPYCGERLGK